MLKKEEEEVNVVSNSQQFKSLVVDSKEGAKTERALLQADSPLPYQDRSPKQVIPTPSRSQRLLPLDPALERVRSLPQSR